MEVKLVWITPDPESVIAYCARVSSKLGPHNDDPKRVIKYCLEHKHWSIFEMATACLEIECSRTISRQILRHRSFSFQEFSQRYEDPSSIRKGFDLMEARRQGNKNRQASIADVDEETARDFFIDQTNLYNAAYFLYDRYKSRGLAKECLKAFLLEGLTPSRLMMSGTIRSWIHYIEVRIGEDVQPEHRDVAIAIKYELRNRLPIIGSMLNW
jgi:thymidylate synthase (FAD)